LPSRLVATPSAVIRRAILDADWSAPLAVDRLRDGN
jgi:hypothetical protein